MPDQACTSFEKRAYLSPLHLFTSSPLHLFTSSPLHLFTSSPLHLFTSSPLHLFTSSPLHPFRSKQGALEPVGEAAGQHRLGHEEEVQPQVVEPAPGPVGEAPRVPLPDLVDLVAEIFFPRAEPP